MTADQIVYLMPGLLILATLVAAFLIPRPASLARGLSEATLILAAISYAFGFPPAPLVLPWALFWTLAAGIALILTGSALVSVASSRDWSVCAQVVLLGMLPVAFAIMTLLIAQDAIDAPPIAESIGHYILVFASLSLIPISFYGLAFAPGPQHLAGAPWRPNLWASPGIITAVLLALLVGLILAQPTQLVQFPPNPAPVSTPAPTPTHVPLSWQASVPPVPLIREISPPQLVVAPTDGNTAYLCATSPGQSYGPPQVWVTHDRAAHWTPSTGLSSALTSGTNSAGCQLVVDKNQPKTVVAVLDADSPNVDSSHVSTAVSFDGGSTWRVMSTPPSLRLLQLASVGTSSYAMFDGGAPPTRSLWRGTDGMRSWVKLDATTDTIEGVWAHPLTGEVLVGVANPGTVLASHDAGKTWATVKFFQHTKLYAQPVSPSGWRLCTEVDSTVPGAQQNDIACSPDEGRSWINRQAGIPTSLAMSPVGTLLGTETTTTKTSIQMSVYRLVPNADPRLAFGAPWEALGISPEPILHFGASESGGVLWAVPETGIVMDPQQRIFTAVYEP